MIGARPVARVRHPSVAEFRAIVAADRPVVLTDVMTTWPALERWTLRRLADEQGDARVEVRARRGSDPQVFAGDPLAAFDREWTTLRTLIDATTSPRDSSRYYLQYCDLRATFPALANDVVDPPYLPRWLCSRALFWLCGDQTINPLHYDFNHVLLAQVVGCKRFLLLPPRDSALIASPIDRFIWRTTAFDPWVDAPRDFPRASAATPFECEVRPGEILFIPYRWWHSMRAEGASVSVTWWWEPSIWTRLRDDARTRVTAPVRGALRWFRRGSPRGTSAPFDR